MKRAEIAVLTFVLAASAAVSALAAPRCSNGAAPVLTGDAFAPVACSTAAKTAPPLPGSPPLPDPKADLRALEGRWEGSVVHALGRYQVGLSVKTGWTGKVAVVLDLLELQFREKLTDSLALAPAKEKGAYAATLTTSLAPQGSLTGTMTLGFEPPAVSSAAPVGRQADLAFANGASHRLAYVLRGKDELELAVASSVPGAPPQKLRVVLTRAKK